VTEKEFRAGFIALIGRPNVGKSTLLNHIVGQKLSIVSSKPQTTRRRVLGVRTTGHAQLVFVDTPGLHGGHRKQINRAMNRTATGAIADADLVLWMVEALRWQPEDDFVLARLTESRQPVGLVVNKMDRVKPPSRLLPFLDEIARKREFAFVIPVSATAGTNVERLEMSVAELLPRSPALFPPEQVTDLPQRVWVTEIIREKLLERLHDELPHAVAVEIDHWQDEDGLTRLAATIWVERDSQKAIVIGAHGQVLKAVGRDARLEIERELERKVFLELWVKVQSEWSDDLRKLRALGLGE
jgi:GTP-binding protein Era